MIINKNISKNSHINYELILINIFWVLYVCFNRLQLSGLQFEWDYFDFIKLIFIVPLASLLFYIYCVFNKNRVILLQNEYKISNNKIFISLTLIIILLIIDLIINGMPVFLASNPEELNNLRLEIRIPFLYSFLLISLNVLIIFLLFQRKSLYRNYLLIIAILFFILHSSVMVARGTVIYLFASIGVYLLIYYKKIKNSIKIIYFILTFIIILIIFDLAGEYREGSNFSIHEYGEFSSSIPSSIAWLWGYAIVNLDNLVLILNDEHIFQGKVLYNFSLTLFKIIGNDITDYQDLPYIGRFNLPTGFGFIAYDFGYFGVLLFTFLLLIFLNYTKLRSKFSVEWCVAYIFMIEGIVTFPISNWFISSKGLLLILSIICISKFIINKSRD